MTMPSNALSQQQPSSSRPLFTERPVRIICIGAGSSGLVLAYKLRRSFKNFELVVYEKNDNVSGTWFENRYPGCACDVPAHIYTYSFEPKTNWSSVYAGSHEIHQYFEDFARKYELYQYIQIQHQVTGARWDETSGEWEVKVQRRSDGEIITDRCHILVNCTGALNTWKWPDIPGLHTFKGDLLQTAKWDQNVVLKDKVVGLIGNGSSAIQVLPAIYPEVKKLVNFIRTPTWITPLIAEPQHFYTEEEKLKFKTDPQSHLAYRKAQAYGMSKNFPLVFRGSETHRKATERMTQVLKDKLPPHLVDDLTPKFSVGCRRMTPGTGYLEALTAPKTQIVLGGVDRITERGCIDSKGVEHKVDVLICATGFDTSFRLPFPIVGASGVSLADAWKDEAKNYFGVGVPDFPNYFMIFGPGSPVATGPSLHPYELQADYILKMVDRYQTENIHSMVPNSRAVDELMVHRDKFMERTVWSEKCGSWYQSGTQGKLAALWPGSGLHFLLAIAEPRYEDWDYKYKGNRFEYLGNGISQVETEDSNAVDWAWYLRNSDNTPHLSRSGRLRALTSKL
ncbi:FAD/NAD(P)-binding domain-containing protein [Panaeolus papilionaceus]|nr:FAD/NAD(P)-binding domain-containing protein [Panaeolus papilionaceus]